MKKKKYRNGVEEKGPSRIEIDFFIRFVEIIFFVDAFCLLIRRLRAVVDTRDYGTTNQPSL